MRRIPCPSRAFDPSHSLPLTLRTRISPLPNRVALPPCIHLRTSSAAFSTTPGRSFLLPGKQDKKKHQQFVRRWQKRLLGDSEPIGAHVDPYDPTSPVRIAPEEQGEYEEVLEDDRAVFPLYRPATTASGLRRVGGEQWLRQKLEGDMAKEFEKLTLRTYTPLTLQMADDIEELTGTPYTLRDENLLMAQTVHDVTGRPYTDHNFGLHSRGPWSSDIRNRFIQAVAEVHALQQAGLSTDLSKSANRGVYDVPRWVKDIKLHRTESDELALVFPKYKTAAHLLTLLQAAPTLEPLLTESDELVADEGADLSEVSVLQEQLPTMDPDTPVFKRAAVVKQDADKKPFDFMSNRPVPREKPVESSKVVEQVVGTKEPSLIHTTPVETSLHIRPSAVHVSQLSTGGLSHSTTKASAHSLENRTTTSSTLEEEVSYPTVSRVDDGKWRTVPLVDVGFKFALFKRIFQLTGIRIPDPQLSASSSLGDMYGYLCAAAKPQPAGLFSTIHVEGQRARGRAKQISEPVALARRRADLGDLINLGNVELRRVKSTKTEKRTKTGLDKVVQYALWERGLGSGRSPTSVRKGTRNVLVTGRTRGLPEVGKPMSSKGASFLAKKTLGTDDDQNRRTRALDAQ